MTEPRITYRSIVYPFQCDSMGHFTTQYYMAAFDQAAWHFLWEAGFDQTLIAEEKIGWADVHHEIEYLRELREGELFYIESKPVRLSNKTILCQMEMKLMAKDELCARLTATTVQFDLTERRAIPLLPRIREQLLAWLDPGATGGE